jgi:hypothetical protein
MINQYQVPQLDFFNSKEQINKIEQVYPTIKYFSLKKKRKLKQACKNLISNKQEAV